VRPIPRETPSKSPQSIFPSPGRPKNRDANSTPRCLVDRSELITPSRPGWHSKESADSNGIYNRGVDQ